MNLIKILQKYTSYNHSIINDVFLCTVLHKLVPINPIKPHLSISVHCKLVKETFL